MLCPLLLHLPAWHRRRCEWPALCQAHRQPKVCTSRAIHFQNVQELRNPGFGRLQGLLLVQALPGSQASEPHHVQRKTCRSRHLGSSPSWETGTAKGSLSTLNLSKCRMLVSCGKDRGNVQGAEGPATLSAIKRCICTAVTSTWVRITWDSLWVRRYVSSGSR